MQKNLARGRRCKGAEMKPGNNIGIRGMLNFSVLTACYATCCFAGVGWAAELPAATFFRNYQYAQALISPDGNHLGVLSPVSNRVGLAVIDLKNNSASYPFADRLADVDKFFWLTSDRLAFRLRHEGYAESGLMAVDRDGKRVKRLVGPPSNLGNLGRRLAFDWGTHFLSLIPGSTNEC